MIGFYTPAECYIYRGSDAQCLALQRSAMYGKSDIYLSTKKTMSDLNQYVQKRKAADAEFAQDYETGYLEFKIGVLLRQAREEAGLTQEEVAQKLNTKKSAISRMENHAEDVRLSTLGKYAKVLGKKLYLSVG